MDIDIGSAVDAVNAAVVCGSKKSDGHTGHLGYLQL